MAYIGATPNYGSFHSQTVTGDGSTKAWTLDQYVASGESVLVTVGNIIQEVGADKSYVASGNSITFDSAPGNGDAVIIRYLGRSMDERDTYKRGSRFKYIATDGQTVFDSADYNGMILSYTAGDIDVFINGTRIDETDYTATNGTNLTLTSSADSADEVIISAYHTVQIANTVPASGGTFGGNVAMNGMLTMNGVAPFYRNTGNLTQNFTASGGFNNMVVGPFTVDSGVALTIDSNATLTII